MVVAHIRQRVMRGIVFKCLPFALHLTFEFSPNTSGPIRLYYIPGTFCDFVFIELALK